MMKGIIEWIYYNGTDDKKCVLKMEGYKDLYSNNYKELNDELEKRLLNKIVKPCYQKYLPSWLFSHKCRYEVMDIGKHAGNYVVRSLKDRNKYWHIDPTTLVFENTIQQISLDI